MSGGAEPRTSAVRNQAECAPMALPLGHGRRLGKIHERLDALHMLVEGKDAA